MKGLIEKITYIFCVERQILELKVFGMNESNTYNIMTINCKKIS